jgi:DNA adenine methylase
MAARNVAPFQYPGAKHRVAPQVWARLGHDVPRYIEPFAGSLGVLLARPGTHDGAGEIINDADGFIVNVWRAIRHAPDEVAWWLEGPATHADLNARHRWVHTEGRKRVAAVFDNPLHYDAQTAAWYVYGLNVAAHPRAFTDPGRQPGRQSERGAARGHMAASRQPIGCYMEQLATRLRRATIFAGDWTGCVTSAVLGAWSPRGLNSEVAVFLDPPYATTLRSVDLYGVDSGTVSADVLAWCREWGDRSQLRICLAGYASEHAELESLGWQVEAWSSVGGGESRHDERLWYSPACLDPAPQLDLWAGDTNRG